MGIELEDSGLPSLQPSPPSKRWTRGAAQEGQTPAALQAHRKPRSNGVFKPFGLVFLCLGWGGLGLPTALAA